MVKASKILKIEKINININMKLKIKMIFKNKMNKIEMKVINKY